MRRLLSPVLLFCACVAWADPAAWRITAADANAAGELLMLGSIHYLREDDYPLPERIDELYAQADSLVLELGAEDLDPQRVQAALLTAAMLPPGRSLADVLSPELHAAAAAHATSFGIDPAALERLRPWMVALTLTDLAQALEGFHGALGVEQHLLRRAARDGKAVGGLEALDAQIAVFAQLSAADQQALLAQTLDELEAVGESMQTLAAAWRAGSLDALAEELLDDFREFPQLYVALVKERNEAWVLRLEELLTHEQRYLVVVGALHLVGPDSVIDMLEARGWRVAAVE